MTQEALGAWIAFASVWMLVMAYGLAWTAAAGWNHGVAWSLDSIKKQRREQRAAKTKLLPFQPKRED